MTPGLEIRQNRYGAYERHPRHAHEYANISLVLAGSLSERVGRAEACAGPLSVVVKPADTLHCDEFGPRGALLLQLRVPGDLSARLGDAHPMRAWGWQQSPATARWMLRLATDRGGADPADALAECLGAVDVAGGRAAGDPPEWLRRARERIRDECATRIRVSELAHEAGVHPVHLTREFRRWYGCSVTGCIAQERTARVAAALADDATTLARVAFATGFADQPHLTRVFKRLVGVTPGAYRSLVADAVV